jgi:DNA polymerase-4
VRAIGGIGRQTGALLARLGIHSVRDLREAPDAVLAQVFGRYAGRMRDKAAGIDRRPVCVHRPDQSISNEETFDRDIDDPDTLKLALGALADRVGARLQRKALQGAVVSIKIRQHDFRTCSRQRHVSPPVGEPAPLLRVAVELLDAWLNETPAARLRLLGVGVSALSPATQLKLFDAGAGGRPLDDTLSSIRERFGAEAVFRGRVPRGR